ncbi:hypothetical protein RF55_8088 [Lasius niger]|uniref:Uncharacterized protein n=1 Tax=Lasius niger TaxID=67767 RepID=A0A0J7KNS9_LASNI|nr:hypothetical protein RF55_8088 [Lasius niger]
MEFMMKFITQEREMKHQLNMEQKRNLIATLQQFQNPNAGSTKIPSSEKNVVAFQIMPDLSKNIEECNGKDPVTAKIWLNNIESMRRLHRWPESVALDTAQMHILKGARKWSNARLTELTTWDYFKLLSRRRSALLKVSQ